MTQRALFALVACIACLAVSSAQTDVTDTDLEAAGGQRMVRLGRASGGGPVVRVPIEVYVARVLAGEGEPRAADAATQALAVAVRTFVLANPGRHASEGFDLCDGTHCQVPRAATAATRRAAMATAGQVLLYRGEPAELFYSASCGGRSERAANVWPGLDLPYLQSVADDVHGDDAPWTLALSLAQVQRGLSRAGFTGQRLREVSIESRTESGRVARLRLSGLQPAIITGDQFRMVLGPNDVRSTAFTLDQRDGTLHLTGSGFGHGVGMCVIGAGRRAQRGEDARAILEQYYPGLDLAGGLGASPVGSSAPRSTAAASSPAPAPTPSLAPAPAPASAVSLVIRVPRLAPISSGELRQMALRAHQELSKVLGTSLPAMTIELHDTLESFRAATGRPWWVSTAGQGSEIDLAPAALLAQRDGIEGTVRVAVARLMMSPELADRPAWVRVGGARYFSRPAPSAPPSTSARLRCPADDELELAISAPAQREAEARAEACFARAIATTRDWRAVSR